MEWLKIGQKVRNDMADIELVIKIPEKVYKSILDINALGCGVSDIKNIIRNCTPLPKGHGRLGDLDALETEMVNGIKAGNYDEGYETFTNINNMDDCVKCVKYADTIIEADEESEGDNATNNNR